MHLSIFIISGTRGKGGMKGNSSHLTIEVRALLNIDKGFRILNLSSQFCPGNSLLSPRAQIGLGGQNKIIITIILRRGGMLGSLQSWLAHLRVLYQYFLLFLKIHTINQCTDSSPLLMLSILEGQGNKVTPLLVEPLSLLRAGADPDKVQDSISNIYVIQEIRQ